MIGFQPSVGTPDPLRERDFREVARLFRRAVHSHAHIDWRTLEEWLPDPAFCGWVMRAGGDIRAVLAATLHYPPQQRYGVAWLRFILPGVGVAHWPALGSLWEALRDDLRRRGIEQVAVIVLDRWVADVAKSFGFTETNAVITLERRGGPVPPAPEPPLVLREMQGRRELEDVVRVDQAAFDSIWQYDYDTLAAAQREAATFSRLELNGEIVGYQLSTQHGTSGHLARLAVLPDAQGKGYGAVLIGHLLRYFEARGISVITVNTQEDNVRSQRLYRRLGFVPTGHRAPVWTVEV